jgi:hypothetical protein
MATETIPHTVAIAGIVTRRSPFRVAITMTRMESLRDIVAYGPLFSLSPLFLFSFAKLRKV